MTYCGEVRMGRSRHRTAYGSKSPLTRSC